MGVFFSGEPALLFTPMEFPKQFDSWYECTRGAHSEALKITSKMGYKYINDNKIAMSYSCREIRSY